MKQVYVANIPTLEREDYLLLRADPAEFARLHPECVQIDLEKNEEGTYVM